jgi:hypothetical protein
MSSDEQPAYPYPYETATLVKDTSTLAIGVAGVSVLFGGLGVITSLASILVARELEDGAT